MAFFKEDISQSPKKKYTIYQRLTYFQWRNYGPAGPAAAGPAKGGPFSSPKNKNVFGRTNSYIYHHTMNSFSGENFHFQACRPSDL